MSPLKLAFISELEFTEQPQKLAKGSSGLQHEAEVVGGGTQ